MKKILALLLTLCLAPAWAQPAPASGVQAVDQLWTDGARQREVPVRLRVPAGAGPFPVILFSHGLGGSRNAGARWGDYWAAHGYLVVNLQHAGSDEAIWKGKLFGAMGRARDAMSAENAQLRTGDVSFVLDELERRRATGDALLVRADLRHIGLSGHSFGAQTTLSVAGEHGAFTQGRADPRIRAAIAMSPAARGTEGGMARQFADIRIPFMSLTGTRDTVSLTPQITPENRRLPYKYMPGPDKYLLVLDGANHMVYGGQPELRSWTPQNTQVHAPLIEEVSLDFWDAYLKGDAKARAALAANGAFSQDLGSKGEWFAK